ncbi:hypothetical protein ACR820_05645 [Streptomyces netropsis]
MPQGGTHPEPLYADAFMLAPGIACIPSAILPESHPPKPYWRKEHIGPPNTGLATKALKKTLLPLAQARREKIGKDKERRPAGGLDFVAYVRQLLEEVRSVPSGQALLDSIPALLPVPEDVPAWAADSSADIRVLIVNAGRDLRSMAVTPMDPDNALNGIGSRVVIRLPYATVLQIGDISTGRLWSPAVMLASLLCHATHMLAGAFDPQPVEVPSTMTPGSFATYSTTQSAAIALGNETALRQALWRAGTSQMGPTVRLPAFESAAQAVLIAGPEQTSTNSQEGRVPAEAYTKAAAARASVWRINEASIAMELGYKPRKGHEQYGQESYAQRSLLVEPRELTADKSLITAPYAAHVKGKLGELQEFDQFTDKWEERWGIAMYLDYAFIPAKMAANAFGADIPSVITSPVKNLYRLANTARMGWFFATMGKEQPQGEHKSTIPAIPDEQINETPATAGGVTWHEGTRWVIEKIGIPVAMELTPYAKALATASEQGAKYLIAVAVKPENRNTAISYVNATATLPGELINKSLKK